MRPLDPVAVIGVQARMCIRDPWEIAQLEDRGLGLMLGFML